VDRNDEWEWVQIPNGEWAAVAKYRDHKLPEYNSNPLIQALPAIFSPLEFARHVARFPQFDPEERELEPHYRFHCIERLSRYFDPQNKSIELQQQICVLIMEGYLGRNLLKPNYARRSRQIYKAIEAGDGNNLENYVDVPTSASSLTLIGPSGIGKTTNLSNILDLYPQVIVHPDHSVYQLVRLHVDCPPTGSLKSLCIDIFQATDKLLGTDYFKKFGSKGNSVEFMLAQVAQLAHTQHLGVLVIDEMQNLVKARRNRDELMNFLVKMDNIIGVPVIRIATNEAFQIFQVNFRNARRAIGKAGVVWDRMSKDREWEHFLKGMWEYQWTKVFVPITEELNGEEKINEKISEAFYEECQGIIDIAIKLYKMVQWRAISLRTEEITVELIHRVAEEGLQIVKPMLDAIRSGDKEWMKKYKDIEPLDPTEYRNQCLAEVESRELEEIRRLAQKQQSRGKVSATVKYVIEKLMDPPLNLDAAPAKIYAMQLVASRGEDTDLSSLVNEAYKLSLQGGQVEENQTKPSQRKTKSKPKYKDNDIRLLVENAKKDKKPAYVHLEEAGIIKNPVEDFIKTV
jgi:hypothetical protein